MDRKADELLITYHREGDAVAREQALVELMPLVRALAARYAGRGEPLEDLVQVGSVGLIKAVDRFDVDRGVDFASYAVPTIVGEIRRHFRDKSWAMHVPRRLKELSVRLSSILDELTAELQAASLLVAPSLGGDIGLREEVRQLVVARNERRMRKGEKPLDVDAEVERQLRELENLGQ